MTESRTAAEPASSESLPLDDELPDEADPEREPEAARDEREAGRDGMTGCCAEV